MSADFTTLNPEEKRALLAQLLAEQAGRRFPLSFEQQRLWFLAEHEGHSVAYNTAVVLRLHGPLQIPVLKRCLDEILRRHDILRTRFVLENGQPWQVVAPRLDLPMPVLNLGDLPPAEREHQARALAAADQHAPFDLGRAPLLRQRLLRLGEQEHLWLLSEHHIISDGWSLGIFLQELAALYPAFAVGRSSPLPELSIQYADYAVWQRQRLSGASLRQLLDYWRRQLAGSPARLELPTDRPRPPSWSGRGGQLHARLDAALSERLKQLGRRSGATLFMTLLAAFAALLSRYSGQVDLVIGSPIAQRNRPELEPLIGFLVNTLALRIDLSGKPNFMTLLRRAQRTAVDAYAHQALPFEKLVNELRPPRDPSQNPIFQVMFTLQGPSQGTIPVGDLMLTLEKREQFTAKFDLCLDAWEDGQGLAMAWEYSSDLFETATIVRMAEHFRVLLAGIAEDPHRLVAELPLLTPTERRTLLHDWNATTTEQPAGVTVVDLFTAQAAKTPGATAAVCGEQRLSYAELNARANRLAHHLRALGAGPEVCVGLCVERSLEMLVGLLGILKAGAAYLPLDPSYPRERLAFMLRDAQVPLLLTQAPLLERLPDTHPPAIALDAVWPQITRRPEHDPAWRPDPESLAYVIYTSGSTGRPKGTLLMHRGLSNYLLWALGTYPLAAGCGAPVQSPLSFDATITSLYLPLLSGRTAVLVPEGQEVEGLGELLSGSADFSLVKITPSHLDLVNQQLADGDWSRRTRALVIGGEALLGKHVLPWRRCSPQTRLINEYGPTESVVGCCVFEVGGEPKPGAAIPIGRPIANTQLYVLDGRLQPVPIGVPSELYIGGAGLARGYLNRPALTAERFIPDPFGPTPGARLYRTGDRARCRPDGTLEYLGRLDHQVKIRGFRIELGEVEVVLAAHPQVREAAVTVQVGPSGERLVAYVAPHRQPGPSTAALREFLNGLLPYYMVPAEFITLAALPLSGNGKVDRKALPAPAGPQADYAAPCTLAERTLAAIWAEVLGLEQVGVHGNFFELGGDSILSIQVAARAHQAGLRLSPHQLFQHQTVAELAATIGTEAPAPGPAPEPAGGPAPLTPIQHWFFERELLEPRHFNQAVLLEVAPGLNPDSLRQAIAALVSHHDALRLRFVDAAGGWQQHLADREDAVLFTHLDLAGRPMSEQLAAITARSAELQTSLDLSNGPLLRVAWFDLGPCQPGRLLLIVHHLAVDGVSWRILLEDLTTAYQQLGQGQPIVLPPKTHSFKQWAGYLQDYSQSRTLTAELEYWLALACTLMEPLPVDYPAGQEANTMGSTAQLSRSLSEAATRALLQDVPRAYHTQINDVLLTALMLAYRRWSGEPALLVELEGHGREDLSPGLDISRTVGWFTSLFPVLLTAPEGTHPGEALVAVKEHLRRLPNRGIGYGLLRYLCREAAVRARLKALPHPEVGFNYLGRFDAVHAFPWLGLAEESPGPAHSPREVRSHLLELSGLIANGRLRLDWTYSENLHRRASIEDLAQAYLDALAELIAHCRSAPGHTYTPSDFPEAGLDRRALETLARQINKR